MMTAQPSLPLAPLDKLPSKLDQLAAFFQQRPGQWVDGEVLGRIAGKYAWRTRVSELRTRRVLVIENRQRRVSGRLISGAISHWTVSEYRYVPQEK